MSSPSPAPRNSSGGGPNGGSHRRHGARWWAAVAAVTRQVGDLEVAEDAVQDACAAALAQWPVEGVPASPRGWLIGTARHKALDRLRRERRRADKEAEAMREEWGGVAG